MNDIILEVSSATYANKAMKLLSKHGIVSKIIKIKSAQNRGCGYGIVVYRGEYLNAAALLKEGGINYRTAGKDDV